jgi:hypothetical protein
VLLQDLFRSGAERASISRHARRPRSRHGGAICFRIQPDLEFWISGSSAQVLASYDAPQVLVAGARARSSLPLERSIEVIQKLKSQPGIGRLLVRALPVTYSSPRHMPVGGGWPYFVTRIYKPGRERAMVEVFALQR